MSETQQYQTAAYYLPHETPMVLLDEVCSITDMEVTCQVEISSHGILAPFLNTNGDLPSWFTFEMMAQAIGVWSGWQGQKKGEQPQLGMLLGMRAFTVKAPILASGSVLKVHALQLLQDDRLGSFQCQVIVDDQVMAQGRLNVYQPSLDELGQLFQTK